MRTGSRVIRAVLAVSLVVALPASAQTPAAGARATVTDEEAIRAVLVRQFEKPDAPLQVAPVSIADGYAVVGWAQSGRGGRAILRNERGKWTIEVCGGDGLRNERDLAQMGVSRATAKALADKNRAAEARLPKAYVRQLSLFDGIMRIDQGDPHPAPHK